MVPTPWRGPNYPGEPPTLGWQVLDWVAEYLIVPGGRLPVSLRFVSRKRLAP
ncbi:hypothetical protein OG426_10125 [Streptomyces canus]|uniref:hypothetical protein n=1 Tax=Streptomyces canus TaxID=58343 RepID=UPI00386D6692|nr:hypothetical protein OG426_10125 [Streptomyces canus]